MEDTLKTYQVYGGRLPSTADILALDADDSEKLRLLSLKRVCWAALSIQIAIIIAITSIAISIAEKGNVPIDSKDAYMLGLIMGALPMAGFSLALISFHSLDKLKSKMREIMFRDPKNEPKTPS